MEIALIPKKITASKTYRHFKVPAAAPVAVVEENKKLQFFYVGRNAASIDKLIRSFECGYAAETRENAQFILQKLLNHNHVIPDAVIVDDKLGFEEIQSLYFFIASRGELSNVPFIIDSANNDPASLEILRKCPFVDEILSPCDLSGKNLMSRIGFLRKVKSNPAKFDLNTESSYKSLWSVRAVIKRVFDLLVSTMLLLVLSPFFFVIALVIKIESPGPVFYISKRAGRGYKIFNFFKFRTMNMGADEVREDFTHLNQYTGGSQPSNGPVFFKINNDPRITRIGRFLRKTSLDELPQLLNVLVGDMSLVGNRPLPLYEAATLTTNQWALRFMAPAGITGLWQIKKRGHDEMSAEERIVLDLAYAERYNFTYDLWIMANTPSALMQKSNA